jgi:hypothetical protein
MDLGVRLQPAQAVPRPGHPLRQAGRLLPVRDRHWRDRVVAACRLTGHALMLTLGSMWCMTRSTSWELIGPPRSGCGRARCQLRMCA